MSNQFFSTLRNVWYFVITTEMASLWYIFRLITMNILVADFAWKTEKKRKHPNTKFLPIFKGRNNIYIKSLIISHIRKLCDNKISINQRMFFPHFTTFFLCFVRKHKNQGFFFSKKTHCVLDYNLAVKQHYQFYQSWSVFFTDQRLSSYI